MEFNAVFTECNNHLRDSDHKRDQLMYFYVLITGAYFAVLNNTKTEVAAIVILPFSLTLLVFGIILARTLTDYRKWHIRYLNTARLVLAISRRKKKRDSIVRAEEEQLAYAELGITKANFFLSRSWLRRYFAGVEFLTYNAFLLFTFLPLYILLSYYHIGSILHLPQVLIYFIDLVTYLLIMNLWSAHFLYHSFLASPWAEWLLKGNRRLAALVRNP